MTSTDKVGQYGVNRQTLDEVMIQYLGLYDVNRQTQEEVMLYAGLYDVDRHCHDTTRGVI